MLTLLFILFVISVIGGMIIEYVFLPDFKDRYPEEYIKAGRPFWFSGSIKQTNFFVYLLNKKNFDAIEDSDIRKKLEIMRFNYILTAMFLLLYGVTIAISKSMG